MKRQTGIKDMKALSFYEEKLQLLYGCSI